MNDQKDLQKLIDILFETHMRMNESNNKTHDDNEKTAKWLRKQLFELGYPTIAAGSSWGVLVSKERYLFDLIHDDIFTLDMAKKFLNEIDKYRDIPKISNNIKKIHAVMQHIEHAKPLLEKYADAYSGLKTILLMIKNGEISPEQLNKIDL